MSHVVKYRIEAHLITHTYTVRWGKKPVSSTTLRDVLDGVKNDNKQIFAKSIIPIESSSIKQKC